MAKEHENKPKIQGKLVKIESRSGTTKTGKEYIGGNLHIETGEDNIIPVSFFATPQKNDGNPNPVYASLKTVIDEYKSIDSHGRDEADLIEVGASRMQENAFYVRDGQLVRGFQMSAPFFNRKAKIDPEGTFAMSGEIVKVTDEIIKDEPTGNVIVTLLVVTYNNTANLIDFSIEGEKGVQYAKTNFVQGMEVKLSGDIKVVEVIEEKTEEAAFGAPIVEEIRRTERKLLVTSATPPVESAITEEERSTMLAERESKLQRMKEEFLAKQKGGNKPKGAADFSL